MIRRRNPDDGSILPLVLVVSVALFLVVLALARFVTADLTYSRVTRDRAERQASALGAIDYGVERLRLNQTLCNSSVGSIGPIGAGVLDRNGTTTTLTCSRFGGSTIDIAGWAVVITGNGITTDLLEVQGGGTKVVDGPMYIRDVGAIRFFGGGPSLDHRDGDLWHQRLTCPGGPVTLPGSYTFSPAEVRGTLCTTAAWNQLVATPTIPDLMTLLPNDGSVFIDDPSGCRVFAPGWYTGVPQMEPGGAPGPDVYFQSGLYWFDGVGPITVGKQTVWFGNPGTTTPALANPTCEAARLADPNVGGVGAVAYMGGSSRWDIDTQGSAEFFPRQIVQYAMSVQELEAGSGYTPSTVTAATTSDAIVRVANGSGTNAVIRGMVFTPNASFRFENAAGPSSFQQLLGGAVVARMGIQASASATNFKIATASAPTLTKIELTATSTDPQGETVVRALVDYRPDEADLTKRVAINSLRVVD